MRESASDGKRDANPSSSHDGAEVENKAGVDPPTEDNTEDPPAEDTCCAVGVIESKVSTSKDGTDSQSGDKAAESASDSKNPAISSMDYSAVDIGNNKAEAELCTNN